jgi:hypothetical protein
VEIGPWEPNANARLLDELMGGIDGVCTTGDRPDGLPEMLKDVMLGAIDVQVTSGTPSVLNWLLKEAQRQGVSAADLSLFVRLPYDTTELVEVNAQLRGYPKVRLFEVDDQQHGTTSTKLAIKRGRERLVAMLAEGLSIDDACARLQFRLYLGDDLFLEAARLRAFREAWAAVVDEFKPRHDCSHTTWIQAVVSYPHEVKSSYDNIIRATLQAISAITGGCDGLTIPTPALPEGDVLARRVVRNIHNLLRDESFLDRVADPIGGSYSVEKLTDVLVNAMSANGEKGEGGEKVAAHPLLPLSPPSPLSPSIPNREELPLKSYYTRVDLEGM